MAMTNKLTSDELSTLRVLCFNSITDEMNEPDELWPGQKQDTIDYMTKLQDKLYDMHLEALHD